MYNILLLHFYVYTVVPSDKALPNKGHLFCQTRFQMRRDSKILLKRGHPFCKLKFFIAERVTL